MVYREEEGAMRKIRLWGHDRYIKEAAEEEKTQIGCI